MDVVPGAILLTLLHNVNVSMPCSKFALEGKVLGGMKLTPCGGYMVYPLGSILVVRSMTGKNKQAFLEGHTSEISCVAMSSDGTRIVSGQVCLHLSRPRCCSFWRSNSPALTFAAEHIN